MSDGADFPTLPQVLAGEKRWCFIIGDNRETIKQVPDNVVQCIVTSPPYFRLRDYQTGIWEGGSNPECDHLEPGTDRGEREELPNPPAGWAKRAQGKPYAGTCGKCGATRVDKQIGLEETPDQFCAALVELLRECRRVLHPTGTFWLNLGDSYNNAGSDRNGEGLDGKRRGGATGPDGALGYKRKDTRNSFKEFGIKRKDLMMMPARLAIALQNDGWYLRSFIPWIKRNPMPESVDDRPGSTIEFVMLFAKSPDYFYDAEAVRVPGAEPERERKNESIGGKNGAAVRHGEQGIIAGTLPTRGRRNADWFFESWQGLYEENGEPLAMVVNIEGFKGSHFACVDTDTEALTPKGWRRESQLKDGDWIAAYDRAADKITWQPATFHRYEYSGDLISIDKRDTSQRLTPNHRCLVLKRHKRGPKTVEVVEASQLKASMELPMLAPWGAGSIAGIGRDFAELVGWYVTEGEAPTAKRKTAKINQSDSANPEKVVRIRGLLKSLGAEFKEVQRARKWRGSPRSDTIFTISGKLRDDLADTCQGKMIPAWAHELPENEAQAMLAALIDGDGHRRRDGRAVIIQKSRESIERMQILAIRCGYRALLRVRPDGIFALYLTTGRWLTMRRTNGDGVSLERRQYSGVVWCPAVASGFWLARRDGMPFITGNTFPTRLVLPIIQAGTSEKGACPKCRAPWVRIVEKDRQPTRPANDTKVAGTDSAEHGNRDPERHVTATKTIGWKAGCECNAGEPVPCIAMDIFSGTATVGAVAVGLGRSYIGLELSEEYAHLGRQRLAKGVAIPSAAAKPKAVKPTKGQTSIFAD